jgi:hypothetical protein
VLENFEIALGFRTQTLCRASTRTGKAEEFAPQCYWVFFSSKRSARKSLRDNGTYSADSLEQIWSLY